jgi:hypothetical protein
MVLVLLLGVVWVAAASAYWWSQQQYYVGEEDGRVAIFRGVDGIPGLSSVHRTSDVAVEDLPEGPRDDVADGIGADDYADAERIVQNLADQLPAEDGQ